MPSLHVNKNKRMCKYAENPHNTKPNPPQYSLPIFIFWGGIFVIVVAGKVFGGGKCCLQRKRKYQIPLLIKEANWQNGAEVRNASTLCLFPVYPPPRFRENMCLEYLVKIENVINDFIQWRSLTMLLFWISKLWRHDWTRCVQPLRL